MPQCANQEETAGDFGNKGESQTRPKARALGNCAKGAAWHSCPATDTESLAHLRRVGRASSRAGRLYANKHRLFGVDGEENDVGMAELDVNAGGGVLALGEIFVF